jgi:hypothetical protein
MPKQGRHQTYFDTAIQCCIMLKSLFRLSLGMVTGFVQSLIKLCGLDWTTPDYSIIYRRQKHIDIAILGDKLNARNFQSQVNEIHARIAVLNKFTELGRPPK